MCKKGSPSHRPCQPDTYPAKPLEGNYHLGQSCWVDGVIQSGQTYAFDKTGRRHNLTFHPGAKSSYNTLRKNLVKWRYRAFGSSFRIKELSRSNKYTFTMADQTHWHQQTDTSIPDPVARRNVVTLKDTQGGFHEIFVLNPTPENEIEARKMWVRNLGNICASVMGYTGPVDEIPVPRYLWALPEEEEAGEAGDGDAPGAAGNPGSGRAFRLDLPLSTRAEA